ncbi:C-terminal binding protein [Entomospira culicis]|uniref:C-terminal binding protein n=1 Tax=Entomospira culicis TaxID=2719989 RepID=A0A968L008_9SPIO|nr:C-terminal binding protein [Entomospira culicis]NIZ19249.1 C-terminal binding protein [Entomospira culicis]NIZ69846.1 C-terminal binding protein [Entomospira culicis]WDI36952.1 C-terminal binding protein [Entomospira culicis]WDI38581.1 C-terminal binding protein [Entomospira culicis]
MFKIAVVGDRSNNNHEEERKIFSALQVEFLVYNFTLETDENIAYFKDVDAILAYQTTISKKTIDQLTKCKIIARYGVGTDAIDIEAATAKGIWVTSVPVAAVEEVATHSLAMLLALARNLLYIDKQVRLGRWNTAGERAVHRMSGRRMGFVGFGATAKQLAARLQSFGLAELLMYDPHVDANTARRLGVKKVDTIEQLLPMCDYLSLHLPSTSETRGMINTKTIAMMKDGVILINTARGSLINESDLVEALRSDKIAGAGLDVFAMEPLNPDSALLTLENVILSDHCAYYSVESESEAKRVAAGNVLRVLTGQQPDTPVNQIRP